MPVKRKFAFGIILISIALIFVFGKLHLKKNKVDAPAKKDDSDLPYRTINTLDSSRLIAYEFHKSEGDGGRFLACSAIIRNIDPARDDYKTWCRSIIADIIKTSGTDKIEVCIYDNYEAYLLSEVKAGQHFEPLTKGESDTVDRHTVATYYGDIDDYYENGHTLRFYSEAHNHYTETEVYEP